MNKRVCSGSSTFLEYRGKGQGHATLSYRFSTVARAPLHDIICPGSEGHAMRITIFSVVPEHVLKCSILMKERINICNLGLGEG